MTLQGRAIKKAAVDFGDGGTLPFAPCKRGYVPLVEVRSGAKPDAAEISPSGYKRMVACSFHERARRKRLARDKGKLRGGEVDPNELFWSKAERDASNEPVKGVDVVVKIEAEKLIKAQIK
jgi:hypothetical protein